MIIEWDEQKNTANKLKHGIGFRDAEAVFSGRCVSFQDTRFDYGEERFITIGLLEKREVMIVHTCRENRIRVISMRKANDHEKKIYRERLSEVR